MTRTEPAITMGKKVVAGLSFLLTSFSSEDSTGCFGVDTVFCWSEQPNKMTRIRLNFRVGENKFFIASIFSKDNAWENSQYLLGFKANMIQERQIGKIN